MSNKVLFITGGNGEIGSAIATAFRREGYEVIAPTSKELDCNSEESIDQFFSGFSHQVTAFVHCAGINNPKPYTEITSATIAKSLNINTLSFLWIFQKLTPFFDPNSARVVAISSIYGIISRSGRLEYSASKHALTGMVQTLSLEAADHNILVNAISPGFIETRLTFKNNSQEVIDALLADVPLKRLGSPEDIAELASFLCSSRNNFITGQNIVIDGGYLTGGFQP
jgi:3-oxoacyl-[acyl-carrier protein] reductase